jgi:hypothetical protein
VANALQEYIPNDASCIRNSSPRPRLKPRILRSLRHNIRGQVLRSPIGKAGCRNPVPRRMQMELHRLQRARPRVRIPPGPPFLCATARRGCLSAGYGPVAQRIERVVVSSFLVAADLGYGIRKEQRSKANDVNADRGECRWNYIVITWSLVRIQPDPPFFVRYRPVGYLSASCAQVARSAVAHKKWIRSSVG